MGSLTAPPGSPASSGAAAAEALFMEARRRRQRRWLAGIAAALVAAAVLAVSGVTWLPRAFGQHVGPTGAAGAALVGRSSVPSGRAWFSYRVVTAGLPEAYGT
jgi:peptidoglycan/LPS O-acetylase OafA/YrhL